MSLILNTLSDSRLPALLQKGHIGVFPTDTLYGLVCVAENEEAVRRLYALKNREHKPGTLIAANVNQLIDIGVPRRYLKAVEQLWPNPLSIELPFDIDYITQGTGHMAFRVVADDVISKFLEVSGPLLTTSANHPGEQPANTIQEAINYFGDDVDFYVDGGDLSSRLPSTIIRIVDDEIEVIREGAVKINENGEIIDEL